MVHTLRGVYEPLYTCICLAQIDGMIKIVELELAVLERANQPFMTGCDVSVDEVCAELAERHVLRTYGTVTILDKGITKRRHNYNPRHQTISTPSADLSPPCHCLPPIHTPASGWQQANKRPVSYSRIDLRLRMDLFELGQMYD